ETAQVDRVLGEAAGAEDARDDVERAQAREAVVHPEQAMAVDEAGAAEHRVDHQNARGEQAQASRRQATAGEFCEYAEALLHALVAREAGAENAEALLVAVDRG